MRPEVMRGVMGSHAGTITPATTGLVPFLPFALRQGTDRNELMFCSSPSPNKLVEKAVF